MSAALVLSAFAAHVAPVWAAFVAQAVLVWAALAAQAAPVLAAFAAHVVPVSVGSIALRVFVFRRRCKTEIPPLMGCRSIYKISPYYFLLDNHNE